MRLSVKCLGRQGDGVQHVLIVGANWRVEHLMKSIAGKGSSGCRIEGFLDDDPDRRGILERLGVRYLGPIEALNHLMIDQVIDRVYVCLPMRSSYDTAQRVADVCEAAGVPVFMVADLLPMKTESNALWCMEPQYTPDPMAQPLEEPAFALRSAPEETRPPLLTTLFAALSGLLPENPVLSGRQSSRAQPPPAS